MKCNERPVKLIVALAAALVAAAPAFADGLTVGAGAGITWTLDNQAQIDALTTAGYAVNQVGAPLTAELGYGFAPGWGEPFADDARLTFGARVETLNLETRTHPASAETDGTQWNDINLPVVPIHLFARLDSGWLFADLGAGVFFNNGTYANETGSSTGDGFTAPGPGFSAQASAGYRTRLIGNLSLRIGVYCRYFLITDFDGLLAVKTDPNYAPISLIVPGLNLAVSYDF